MEAPEAISVDINLATPSYLKPTSASTRRFRGGNFSTPTSHVEPTQAISKARSPTNENIGPRGQPRSTAVFKTSNNRWRSNNNNKKQLCFYINTRPKCASLKLDCSGERLTCVGKISIFWNTFSYNIMIKTCKIPWGTPYYCLTICGGSWNFACLYQYSIYFTKMCFKIVNFFRRKSVYFRCRQ
jgi:hypothetical protein